MDQVVDLTLIPEEVESDNEFGGRADPKLVMAEQQIHDVVDQSRSVGALPPSDVSATKNSIQATEGDEAGNAIVLPGQADDQSDKSGPANRAPENILSEAAQASDLMIQHDKIDETTAELQSSISFNHTNGVLQYNAAGDDGSVHASGGSDTDTSRPDGNSGGDGGRHHERSDSMKKPATYKPVSFAKFAVNKGASVSPGGKSSSDKTPTSSNPPSRTSSALSSKPRLVAKSSSGLRDTAPKSLRSGGKNGAGGPDPLQVWNKNRPAPTPSTKHLTDEELKQQYGIHLTSRIQADGEGKESKWADIDDDEEDWALPETLQWSDGTKAYLAGSENVSTPTQGQKPAAARPEEPEDIIPNKTTTSQITSSVGPNATVLKLGASAERQQQLAKNAASQHKGPIEKPIQPSAKNPAPVPSKSPWATLPPVEKVSPIAINPQPPMASPRDPSRDVRPQSPMTGGLPSPTKEISADDFNRSWRQDTDGHPRELFMPNSGRYEAVNEGKRRPSRNDQNFRPPSLLQRPSQGNYHAPAEPSAAFQTHRTSEQEKAPWSRRRTSSNVSGGSGPFGRRMSTSKDIVALHDTGNHRRDSEINGQDAHGRAHGPTSLTKPTTPFAPSPSEMTPSSAAPSGMTEEPSVPAGLLSQQDTHAARLEEIEVQKQLMKEKREQAIKRRQEEEAREDAAKRERIRRKMESLGLPPLEDKSKHKESKPVDAPSQKSPAISDIGLSTTSPPKPPIPVPEASGEPKQYGMMKVHHPDSVKKLVGAQDKSADKAAPAPSKISPEPLQQPPPQSNSESAMVNGVRPLSDPVQHGRPESPRRKSSNEPPSVSTTNVSGPNAVSGWDGPRLNQSYGASGNLWGPPSNNKALGNGTFNQGLAAFPRDTSRDKMPPLDQTPLGANWNGRSGNVGKSPQIPPAQPKISEPTLPGSGQASPDQRPVAANSEADSAQPTSQPAPIGPPQPQRWQPSPIMRGPNHSLAAWNNFHQVAAQDDRVAEDRFRQQQDEARSENQQSPQIVYQETFRQVKAGDAAGQRRVVEVTKSSSGQTLPSMSQFGPVGSFTSQPSGLPPRAGSSRFFQQQQMSNLIRPTAHNPQPIPRSPSPPPAEEFGSPHPAYEEIVNRPRVSLPIPKAVVKLPPPVPAAPPPPPPKPQPITFAAIAAKAPSPPKPNPPPNPDPPNWQERFRGLFGKSTPTPEKRQSLPVNVSSKEPLDHSTSHLVAPVSLPQTDSESEGEMWSAKYADEEEMFEDRVAGSLPTVRVSSRTFPHDWQAARLHPRKSRPVRAVEAASIQVFDVLDLDATPRSKDMTVLINVPGAKEARSKVIPRKNLHQPASKTLRHASGIQKNRKGGPKSREVSRTHPGPASNSAAKAGGTANGFAGSPKGGQSQSTWRGPRASAASVAS